MHKSRNKQQKSCICPTGIDTAFIVISSIKFFPQKDTELRKPDFRHTLYWHPDVRPDVAELSFYTSDLCGTFKVVVEAVTDNGEIVKGETVFIVNE